MDLVSDHLARSNLLHRGLGSRVDVGIEIANIVVAFMRR